MTRRTVSASAAAALALATLAAGIHWGSTTAGGADSYGYISQAQLWRQRQLSIDQDIVRASPWPLATETWAPLGFRPSGTRPYAIVPLYPPGLPLLMAGAQAVAGFCAAFLVVPLCGALTIWLTFLLGRLVTGRGGPALSAAALVATSPIFLYQLMNPMSDVPATAAWTSAVVLACASRAGSAGLAAAAAVLIRPNLAPVALVMAVWLAAARRGSIRFLIAPAAAAVIVAAVNRSLYGGALLSGYGSADSLYAFGYAGRNVRQFGGWLLETQTPAVLLGIAGIVVPKWTRCAAVPRAPLLLGGVAAAVVGSYLFYIPFDAWWYLRFLLPMWPVLMVGMAIAIEALTPAPERFARSAVLAIVTIALAANGVRVAAARFAFDIGRAERRYVDVARFVTGHTESAAVMISLQHSGSLRLYAGRLTLRFDQLDPLWLDRVIAYLHERGRHPYIVVEDAEVELFRSRFSGVSVAGGLDWSPLAVYDSPRVAIYDPIARSSGAPLAIGAAASRRAGWRCDLPAPTPDKG